MDQYPNPLIYLVHVLAVKPIVSFDQAEPPTTKLSTCLLHWVIPLYNSAHAIISYSTAAQIPGLVAD